MLKLTKIDVRYGELQVLKNISLEVNEGEIVSLLGPNGAGKTTLLKTIMGILNPISGSIEFVGERIEKLPIHERVRRGITLVMEGRRLFPYLNVKENLELGAHISKAWKTRRKNFSLIYNLFPILKERKSQLAGSLSGGEQQILAIARALMSTPRLLMLDEPCLDLTPRLVGYVFSIIKKINRQGITILVATQNVENALSISTRAYFLENGEIASKAKIKNF